uniref:Uncharacterized protein n=1 Tax=Eutreptiella gymnastica TaxID=73025 RepID=A0A7S4FWG7_9EUGL
MKTAEMSKPFSEREPLHVAATVGTKPEPRGHMARPRCRTITKCNHHKFAAGSKIDNLWFKVTKFEASSGKSGRICRQAPKVESALVMERTVHELCRHSPQDVAGPAVPVTVIK